MPVVEGFVALSHAPFWDPDVVVEGAGERFVQGVDRARALVNDKKPDALVVFGPDHFRNFFYDVLPSFCIGLEKLTGFGDYATPKGDMPVDQELARAIHGSVIEAGFDPAFSLNMGADHGITQPCAVFDPSRTLPVVPIMINCAGAPRPPMRRCYEFGKAVGDAIRSAPGNKRVVIIGSGGLSHWVRPASADNPETTAETLEYAINGRNRAVEYSAERDAFLQERIDAGISGKVNADWDNWFLECLTSGNIEPILALKDTEIDEVAGNGAHELRSWIAAAGAWGGSSEVFSYEPVPSWVTGMGCIGGSKPV